MRLTRRNSVTGALSMCLVGTSVRAAGSAAISAAVLAITHAQPKSLDGLWIDSENGVLPLSAFRGRVVILNLWATWCLPCRREMPSLSQLQSRLDGQRFAVLPVAFDRRGLPAVRDFFAETAITNLPALSGDATTLQELAPNIGLPSTYVLDKEGLMRWSVAGEAQWDDEDTLRWLNSLATG